MAKVTIGQTFVGSPEELDKYGGQIPANLKDREDRMSDEEKAAFAGKIHVGTVMEVDDKRAQQLKDLGLVEGVKKKAPEGQNQVIVSDKQREKAQKKTGKEKRESKGIPSRRK
jgi:hypothetical protein